MGEGKEPDACPETEEKSAGGAPAAPADAGAATENSGSAQAPAGGEAKSDTEGAAGDELVVPKRRRAAPVRSRSNTREEAEAPPAQEAPAKADGSTAAAAAVVCGTQSSTGEEKVEAAAAAPAAEEETAEPKDDTAETEEKAAKASAAPEAQKEKTEPSEEGTAEGSGDGGLPGLEECPPAGPGGRSAEIAKEALSADESTEEMPMSARGTALARKASPLAALPAPTAAAAEGDAGDEEGAEKENADEKEKEEKEQGKEEQEKKEQPAADCGSSADQESPVKEAARERRRQKGSESSDDSKESSTRRKHRREKERTRERGRHRRGKGSKESGRKEGKKGGSKERHERKGGSKERKDGGRERSGSHEAKGKGRERERESTAKEAGREKDSREREKELAKRRPSSSAVKREKDRGKESERERRHHKEYAKHHGAGDRRASASTLESKRKDRREASSSSSSNRKAAAAAAEKGERSVGGSAKTKISKLQVAMSMNSKNVRSQFSRSPKKKPTSREETAAASAAAEGGASLPPSRSMPNLADEEAAPPAAGAEVAAETQESAEKTPVPEKTSAAGAREGGEEEEKERVEKERPEKKKSAASKWVARRTEKLRKAASRRYQAASSLSAEQSPSPAPSPAAAPAASPGVGRRATVAEGRPPQLDDVGQPPRRRRLSSEAKAQTAGAEEDGGDGAAAGGPFPGVQLHEDRGVTRLPPSMTHEGAPRKSLKQLRKETLLPGSAVSASMGSVRNVLVLGSKALPALEGPLCDDDVALLVEADPHCCLSAASTHYVFRDDSFLADAPDVFKEIDLSNNKIETVAQLSQFTTLKRLFLRRNPLKSLDFTGLGNLLVLSMEDCGLTELPNFEHLTSLVQLDLRGNPLASGFEQLGHLKCLQSLDMSRCKLQMEMAAFKADVLSFIKDLPQLQYLCLGENPITTQYPEFKYVVIDALPQLQTYDYERIPDKTKKGVGVLLDRGIKAVKITASGSIRLTPEEIMSSLEAAERRERMAGAAWREATDEQLTAALGAVLPLLTARDVAAARLVSRRWNVVARELQQRRARTARPLCVVRAAACPPPGAAAAAALAAELGERCAAAELEEYDEELLRREALVVLLVSGGPDAAAWGHFYNQLLAQACGELSQDARTRVTVSPYHYLRYAAVDVDGGTMGKAIGAILRQLGASELYPRGHPAVEELGSAVCAVLSGCEEAPGS